MKPITYWLQNEAIDQLVEHFGANLERLSKYDRRLFIALLATRQASIANEAFNVYVSAKNPPPLSTDLAKAWGIAHDLPTFATDKLIEAIAATLTHQPQKMGTPSPRDAHADIG